MAVSVEGDLPARIRFAEICRNAGIRSRYSRALGAAKSCPVFSEGEGRRRDEEGSREAWQCFHGADYD